MAPRSGNDSPDARFTVPLTESPFTANVMVGFPPPLGSFTVAFHVPAIDFACAALDCAATGCDTSMTAASSGNKDLIDSPGRYEDWTRALRSWIPFGRHVPPRDQSDYRTVVRTRG